MRRIAREGGGLAMKGSEEPLPPLSLQFEGGRRSSGGSGGSGGGRRTEATSSSSSSCCCSASSSASADGGADGGADGDGASDEGRGDAQQRPAVAAAPRAFSLRARASEMVGLWRLHAFGCALSFCLNFGSKGSEIWLGTFMEQVRAPHDLPAISLRAPHELTTSSPRAPHELPRSPRDLPTSSQLGLGALSRLIYVMTVTGKMSADFFNCYASRRLGRLRCLQLGFVICALTTAGLLLGLAIESGRAAWLLTLAYLQGFGMDLLWCNLYMLLVERFPTTVRSTGFGVAMGLP